jgi:hypothetical protein
MHLHRGFLVWRRIMRIAFIVLPALILCACGAQPESSSASGTRIYDTQRSALEKAKTVNDTVTQGAEALRAQEEAQAK